MLRRARFAAVMLGCGAILGGCGDAGAAPQTARALFSRHCAACHNLGGYAEPSQEGGPLAHLSLTRVQISQFTAEMPRLQGRLSAAQIKRLTDLLLSLE